MKVNKIIINKNCRIKELPPQIGRELFVHYPIETCAVREDVK